MLGKRIAALRKAKQFTQRELAQRLCISSSALGSYEQGRRTPSAEMLVLLATALGVTTDYLLTGFPAERQQGVSSSQAEEYIKYLLFTGELLSKSRRELTALLLSLSPQDMIYE